MFEDMNPACCFKNFQSHLLLKLRVSIKPGRITVRNLKKKMFSETLVEHPFKKSCITNPLVALEDDIWAENMGSDISKSKNDKYRLKM